MAAPQMKLIQIGILYLSLVVNSFKCNPHTHKVHMSLVYLHPLCLQSIVSNVHERQCFCCSQIFSRPLCQQVLLNMCYLPASPATETDRKITCLELKVLISNRGFWMLMSSSEGFRWCCQASVSFQSRNKSPSTWGRT